MNIPGLYSNGKFDEGFRQIQTSDEDLIDYLVDIFQSCHRPSIDFILNKYPNLCKDEEEEVATVIFSSLMAMDAR